jgi:predicted MPP superfamily phosphohydrolase
MAVQQSTTAIYFVGKKSADWKQVSEVMASLDSIYGVACLEKAIFTVHDVVSKASDCDSGSLVKIVKEKGLQNISKKYGQVIQSLMRFYKDPNERIENEDFISNYHLRIFKFKGDGRLGFIDPNGEVQNVWSYYKPTLESVLKSAGFQVITLREAQKLSRQKKAK